MSSTSIGAAINPPAPDFFGAVCHASRTGVQWLKYNGKALASGAGTTIVRVCTAVSNFFKRVAISLGTSAAATKTAIGKSLSTAKTAIGSLPKDAIFALGIGAVALAFGSALAALHLNKQSPVELEPPASPLTTTPDSSPKL